MRASLSIAPTVPLDASGSPDQHYRTFQLPGGVPTYGNDFVCFGDPGTPPPANALFVIRNGSVDWTWFSLIASHPALQAFVLRCHWSEAGKPFVIGSKADFLARGALATLIQDNVPLHAWMGDTPG